MAPRSSAGVRRDSWRELLERLIEGTRRRTRIGRWLLKREPWNLLFVGYPETHWAGHYFFHLLDAAHPRHDAALAREFGGAILSVYREVDAALGELTRAREDLAVLVFSNTGMGANYSGMHLVPQVLQRLGMSGNDGYDLDGDGASGAHQTFGFLAAGGRGTRSAGRLESADIMDIAPTILTLQGVAVPAHMDGRALADMIAA